MTLLKRKPLSMMIMKQKRKLLKKK